MKKYFPFFLTFLIAICGFSQDIESAKEELIKKVTLNPFAYSKLLSPVTSFDFVSIKEEKYIKAKLGFEFRNGVSAILGISSPISSSNTDITPLTKTGLSDSTSLKIGIQKIFWRPEINKEEWKKLIEEYKEKLKEMVLLTCHCNDSKEALCKLISFFDQAQLFPDYIKKQKKIISSESATDFNYDQNIIKIQNELLDRINKIKNIISNVGENERDSIISYRNLSDEYKKKADERVFQWKGNSMIFGITGEVSKKNFSYYSDVQKSIIEKSARLPYEFSLSIGKVFRNELILLASCQFTNSYDGGAVNEYLIPIPGSESYQQESLSGRKPERKIDTKIIVESRKYLAKNLGFAPSISYSIKTKNLETTIPFYFISYKEKEEIKGLNGGLFISWVSSINKIEFKEKNLNIGIFFGVLFDDALDLIK